MTDNPYADLIAWSLEHNIDPNNTPLNGVHTFAGVAVIEQYHLEGTRKVVNRRGDGAKRTWPKVRRLRRPVPQVRVS